MVARQCPMRPRCAHTDGVTENSASLTRRRLYAGAGVRHRRRSAAHVRRCVCPRRCRGLTEGVTARAVMLCHCCERRWRCYVGALETRYYGSGASESVEGEVRRADPFSVNFYLCTINRKLRETLRIVKKKDRDGELLC